MKKPIWRRIVRIAVNSIVSLVLSLVLLYALGTKLFPDLMARVIPYQMYTVVTDSMEPTIPVGSLVVSRQVDESEPIAPGTIITFNAVRFGEPIVLTHYLDSVEEYEGAPRYRTHAEGTDYKDDYVTRRSDILGVYVTHFPNLGKVALFLTSVYGIVMFSLCFIIFLINMFVRKKLDDERDFAQNGVRFKKLRMKADASGCAVSGILQNRTREELELFRVRFSFQQGKKVLYEETVNLLEPGKGLGPGEALPFTLASPKPLEAESFKIEPVQVGFAIRATRPVCGKPPRKPFVRFFKADREPARPQTKLPKETESEKDTAKK